MFDAKLKEGVEYFEQMLKVMPDDRTTLEFLVVAYVQLGENAKSEAALASLARVLLKEGDTESAVALLPRLEACSDDGARQMAVRIHALSEPKPELVPEAPRAEPSAGAVATAAAAEATLAERLGEHEAAGHLRQLPDNGRPFLVSALATLEREKPEACAKALARLADETGCVPVPLDSFEPDRKAAAKLGDALVRVRGVIPFATLGDTALVAYLSPGDRALESAVAAALGRVRFYLAEPRLVEAALLKLHPEDAPKN